MLHANFDKYGFGSDTDMTITYPDPTQKRPANADQMAATLGNLQTHFLIILVRISSATGALVQRLDPGVDHWVVLDKLNGNKVELYNPFPNRREEYSIRELYNSNEWVGVWVKRKVANAGNYTPAKPAASFEVQLDIKKPDTMTAEQYIAREGAFKFNLCGEFSVTYILG